MRLPAHPCGNLLLRRPVARIGVRSVGQEVADDVHPRRRGGRVEGPGDRLRLRGSPGVLSGLVDRRELGERLGRHALRSLVGQSEVELLVRCVRRRRTDAVDGSRGWRSRRGSRGRRRRINDRCGRRGEGGGGRALARRAAGSSAARRLRRGGDTRDRGDVRGRRPSRRKRVRPRDVQDTLVLRVGEERRVVDRPGRVDVSRADGRVERRQGSRHVARVHVRGVDRTAVHRRDVEPVVARVDRAELELVALCRERLEERRHARVDRAGEELLLDVRRHGDVRVLQERVDESLVAGRSAGEPHGRFGHRGRSVDRHRPGRLRRHRRGLDRLGRSGSPWLPLLDSGEASERPVSGRPSARPGEPPELFVHPLRPRRSGRRGTAGARRGLQRRRRGCERRGVRGGRDVAVSRARRVRERVGDTVPSPSAAGPRHLRRAHRLEVHPAERPRHGYMSRRVEVTGARAGGQVGGVEALCRSGHQHAGEAGARFADLERIHRLPLARELLGQVVELVLPRHCGRVAPKRRAEASVRQEPLEEVGCAVALVTLRHARPPRAPRASVARAGGRSRSRPGGA